MWKRQKVQEVLWEERRMSWYVIHVRVGKEEAICYKIRTRVPENLWEECFVPQVETIYKKAGEYQKVIKPLFPGYVFLVCQDPEQVAVSLRKVPDFTRILKTGEYFEPLRQQEIDWLLTLAGNEFRVAMSTGYIVGDKICIVEGPMKGMDGAIRKINRHKRTAMVEVSFLGRPTLIRLPLEIVSKT